MKERKKIEFDSNGTDCICEESSREFTGALMPDDNGETHRVYDGDFVRLGLIEYQVRWNNYYFAWWIVYKDVYCYSLKAHFDSLRFVHSEIE